MVDSPRMRRLRSDFRAMERLRAESSIIDFDFRGDPPTRYRVVFHGKGFWRAEKSNDVLVRDRHEVTIELAAAYPRMIPELAWQTPIFHPNISASGIVCLGGYSTHWAPSLTLDELCIMLWDMIRYKNFDVESPYNRDAAIWAKANPNTFPIDRRPLRDRISGDGKSIQAVPPVLKPTGQTATPGGSTGGQGRGSSGRNDAGRHAEFHGGPADPPQSHGNDSHRPGAPTGGNPMASGVTFIDAGAADSSANNADSSGIDIVDAEIIDPEDTDILFID